MMLSFYKNLEEKKPTILLNIYNILSLIVLIFCIIITAFFHTFNFIKIEKQRSETSIQQLENFFEFQYRALSEEHWMGNYESISMHVADIAKKFGNAKYGLFIISKNGTCLGESSSNNEFNSNCELPNSIKDIYTKNQGNLNFKQKLTFDLKRNKYIYFAPLNVGLEKSGYIYVEIIDPYNFYRGTLFSKLWSNLLPILLIMICIWLLWILISKNLILKPYFGMLRKAEKKEALGTLAAQVAHDIRSPLAALEMIVQTMNAISEDKRILIRSAVGRIRDIAGNLLTTHKQPAIKTHSDKYNSQEESTHQFAVTILESIITEKRLQYRDKIGILIEGFLHSEESYDIFIKVPTSNFKRVISNILNNSVEALSTVGEIAVSLKKVNNNVEIIIKDNGKGIPTDILNELGKEGKSYEKSNGHGLGLFHAKNILANCEGQLHIESKINAGTTVRIILPKAPQPIWFIPELLIYPDSTLCIIDDDESIHQIWNKRLLEKIPDTHRKLAIRHFSCPDDLIDWDSNNSPNDKSIYLCDQEFINKESTGIDLIKKLRIESKSILITSHYEENEIQELCVQTGIKLIPKSMAGFAPLNFIE